MSQQVSTIEDPFGSAGDFTEMARGGSTDEPNRSGILRSGSEEELKSSFPAEAWEEPKDFTLKNSNPVN